MYIRQPNYLQLINKRSFFLLGPRQVGKTTYVTSTFRDARILSLLDSDLFRDLSERPARLRELILPQDSIVVIDEIQRLPSLLNEVQLILDRNNAQRFILTGSSARKLRRGEVNLLGGRAWMAWLHPLVSIEVGIDNLERLLNVGGLPNIFDSSAPDEELKAYVGLYLQEEIRAEGLTRSIENFSRLLTAAASCNGEQVNFTKVANDAAIHPRTAREHFTILTDTLIGYLLEAYQKTIKRKAVATPKFYFFDVGIANHLLKRRNVTSGSENFGRAVEHLIFLELRAYLDYSRLDLSLTYWRSRSQIEVDFLIGDAIAIEVKATSRVSARDERGLHALNEEIKLKRKIIVCSEPIRRTTEQKIEIIPLPEFLEDLWCGEII